jgi:hypothetical protein
VSTTPEKFVSIDWIHVNKGLPPLAFRLLTCDTLGHWKPGKLVVRQGKVRWLDDQSMPIKDVEFYAEIVAPDETA